MQSNGKTTMEVQLDYDVNNGNKAKLFPPVDISNWNQFCIQVFFKNLQGDVKDSAIMISVSNNGEDFFTIGENYLVLQAVTKEIRSLGDSTQFLFCGTGEGLGAVAWVTMDFVAGLLIGGEIDKVILSGKIQ